MHHGGAVVCAHMWLRRHTAAFDEESCKLWASGYETCQHDCSKNYTMHASWPSVSQAKVAAACGPSEVLGPAKLGTTTDWRGG